MSLVRVTDLEITDPRLYPGDALNFPRISLVRVLVSRDAWNLPRIP